MIKSLTIADVGSMLPIENAAHVYPWSEAVLASCFGERYRVFGLFIEEESGHSQLVGYAIYQYLFEEATLMNICINPSAQGRGFGNTLLSHSMQTLVDKAAIEVVFLEVRQSNQAAIALYHKLGFSIDGERKNYYQTASGRETAVLMSKRFAS
ncbi:ribosomal protein S18-alanine N-acetyltransferase [Shewanella avicenniae]|uniref:[Ribosomal protein bS18]-alanine N-acetyltransferase n=2 Tax=Shewanella avicenniae TaxID=2814294 RepID=A0ABX7QWX9_9GAMM|nr:ribosomal protein S18-alanine N-acetyltransferase [Shewanella avicenniae]